ncbi:LysR family transcriptional regulator [Paraburkholderia sp. UYCP14C]|uniref:LysR family transcriptional regulator n=1 Tax=Paraburkholderia sp. UYCP14C TaxID=2511130 RepID=UPI001021A111|nr:LysR family transcriptional regulator [Paraburkholderia sp. UYCP14C]RZF25365.1 LysR family transcriptional regulator [Paraburkholderia sp. UYCP14C]
MINLFLAMQAFVKVADVGSFAQAAAQLNVSTSVVTRHVSSLEQHLGIRLFQRTTRKVVLTEAGAQYADGCRVLLAELDEVESRATTASRDVAGDLRIVALGSFSLFRLTPLFAEYQARFPQVNLRVTLTEKRVDLLEGGFDVGIVTEHMIRSESLVVRRLINSHAVPVAAAAYLAQAGHPQTPAELDGHRLIAAPFDTTGPMWIFRKGDAESTNEDGDDSGESIAIDASFTVNSMIMQKQAALGAMGIALLPLEMVEDELRAGTLVRVLDGYAVLNGDVAVSLVYPSREFVPRKVREFIDLAVGFFK